MLLGKAAHENKEFSGKITVKYKNGKSKTEIPYYLTVLEGGLLFNSSITTYFINESSKQLIPRNVVVKNNFLTPLAVTNVSLPLEAQNFFNVCVCNIRVFLYITNISFSDT